MFNTLCPLWCDFLKEEFKKEYFIKLMHFVEQEYQLAECYPAKYQIFEAFNSCSLTDLKVVIIGQDPYHGSGEANGLSFSVNDGIKIPPSLRNIFKEINADCGISKENRSGNLQLWANQGVLLLNATLTVRKGQAGSHQKQGWEIFTDAVISKISTEKNQVVFLLWGNFAHKKGVKIDKKKHFVLKSGHPSPLSANQGKWFGNKHFSQTNSILKEIGTTEIDW